MSYEPGKPYNKMTDSEFHEAEDELRFTAKKAKHADPPLRLGLAQLDASKLSPEHYEILADYRRRGSSIPVAMRKQMEDVLNPLLIKQLRAEEGLD